jgi:hypothetical protein
MLIPIFFLNFFLFNFLGITGKYHDNSCLSEFGVRDVALGIGNVRIYRAVVRSELVFCWANIAFSLATRVLQLSELYKM